MKKKIPKKLRSFRFPPYLEDCKTIALANSQLSGENEPRRFNVAYMTIISTGLLSLCVMASVSKGTRAVSNDLEELYNMILEGENDSDGMSSKEESDMDHHFQSEATR